MQFPRIRFLGSVPPSASMPRQCSAMPPLYVSVWTWAGNDWAAYLPGGDTATYAASKGFGVLGPVGGGEGFWVNSLGTGEVTISGTLSSGGIPLSAGWNLVGLKGTATKAVSELVAGKTQLISLWKWEGNSWSVSLPDKEDKGAAYATEKGFSLLQAIAPGEGFWVNSNGATTLP